MTSAHFSRLSWSVGTFLMTQINVLPRMLLFHHEVVWSPSDNVKRDSHCSLGSSDPICYDRVWSILERLLCFQSDDEAIVDVKRIDVQGRWESCSWEDVSRSTDFGKDRLRYSMHSVGHATSSLRVSVSNSFRGWIRKDVIDTLKFQYFQISGVLPRTKINKLTLSWIRYWIWKKKKISDSYLSKHELLVNR